jgi:predicted nucleotidyltransferase
MDNHIKVLLSELKKGLNDLYQERLKGVYLYGSYARGESHTWSDVDVIIVLDELDHYWEEIRRSGYLISEISLKYDRSVSRVLVSERDWLVANTPLLLNAHEEAIPV